MGHALPKPSPIAVSRAFNSPESYGTTMAVALMGAYTAGALEWTPEAIREAIADDHGVRLGEEQFGRLMAAIVILTSDRLYHDLPDFLTLANALNGEGYDPDMFDPVDVLDGAWAVAEATLLDRLVFVPEGRSDTFSAEIVAYLQMAMEEEGLMSPPAVLRELDRGDDRRGRVLGEYTSDPAMTAAIVEAEDAKADNITNEVRARMGQLLDQLAALFGMGRPEFMREARLT